MDTDSIRTTLMDNGVEAVIWIHTCEGCHKHQVRVLEFTMDHDTLTLCGDCLITLGTTVKQS